MDNLLLAIDTETICVETREKAHMALSSYMSDKPFQEKGLRMLHISFSAPLYIGSAICGALLKRDILKFYLSEILLF